jgi:hypothetical protein
VLKAGPYPVGAICSAGAWRPLACCFVSSGLRPSPVKWTHETASRVMLAAGVEPIDPYPGTTRPWKCRCLTCRRVVTPSFGNVNRGVSKGCRYCAAETSRGKSKRRWTHESASTVMLEAGLRPVGEFPGADEPWRCECQRCGSQVTPRLSAVRRGASRGCIYCSGHALTGPDAAAREMLDASLRPLEPYPGKAASPWRCECVRCGDVVMARLQKVRTGEGCCKRCGVAASALARSADPGESDAIMRAAMLEPLERYPGGNHLPWRCRCTGCGAVVTPTRANISRGQGGCIACGIKVCAAKRLGDEDQAVLDMVQADLRPLDPYPGHNKPWRCRCLRCDREVAPCLGHIRRGRGGCLSCGVIDGGLKQRTPPLVAEAQLRAGGFEPLEPYPGLASTPWRCRCLSCGGETIAPLYKVRNGIGVCRGCADWGFDTSAPAVLYLLHHSQLGAVKIGITGHSERILRFERRGWTVQHALLFHTGAAAWTLEQTVLARIRAGLGLSFYLTPQQMQGVGGFTETFNAAQLPPIDLRSIVDDEELRLGLT